MKKIFTVFLVLFFLIISIFIYFNFFYIKDSINVSLKWKHQAQFAGMYLAKEKGYYLSKGIDVIFKEFEFDSAQIDDLLSGESDFVLMSAEELLLYADQGKDIKAVAAFYQNSPYAIVSLKESGIENPSDFIGKTLGNKSGKLEETIFYLLLLKKFGIDENYYNIKRLGIDKKEIDNLLNKDSDTVGLYRTDQLYFFDKNNIEYNVIFPEEFGFNINNDILVTTNELVKNNPQLVKNFITATSKGWERAIGNPKKAIDITMNYVSDDYYKNIDYQNYILENSIKLIKPSTSKKIGNINESGFIKLFSLMKESNLIEGDFNVEDFYTNNFVY